MNTPSDARERTSETFPEKTALIRAVEASALMFNEDGVMTGQSLRVSPDKSLEQLSVGDAHDLGMIFASKVNC